MTPKTREASATLSTSSSGSESTEHLKEAAGELASDVKETASHVAGRAKQQVGRQVESQKDRAAGGLGEMANALRQTSSQLREQKSSSMPEYMERAADQVDRVSGYLRGASVGEMVEGVERFARRDPVLFFGGAFTLGLLAARFLKASSPRSERYGMPGRGYGYDERYGYRGYAPETSTRYAYSGAEQGVGAMPGYGDAGYGYGGQAANNGNFDARTTASNWPPRTGAQAAPQAGIGSELGGDADLVGSTQAGGSSSTTGRTGSQIGKSGTTGSTSTSGERKAGGKGSV